MPNDLFSMFRRPRKPVVIVSGLPRSGTSMMMKILEAGGIPPVTDNLRMADEDNPKGYYELERVKQLTRGDIAWVDEAQGKVVKVISALLEHLPAKFHYRVVFMRREMAEILASQKQMLIRRGEPTDTVEDGTMAEMFQEHLKRARVWLANQPNMRVHYVDYNALMKDPAPHIAALCDFLELPLDRAAMLAVPDAGLYRQKAAQ